RNFPLVQPYSRMICQGLGNLPKISAGWKFFLIRYPDFLPVGVINKFPRGYRRLLDHLGVTHLVVIPFEYPECQSARLTVPVRADHLHAPKRFVGREFLPYRPVRRHRYRMVIACLVVKTVPGAVEIPRGRKPCVNRSVIIKNDRRSIPVGSTVVNVPT